MSLSLNDLLWERKARRYGNGIQGFVLFCSEQVYIQHPQGRRLLDLREAQLETLISYFEHDQVLILKARQIGFTTLTMAYVLWQALYTPDWSCINLSKKEDDAVHALKMAKFAYANLDEELKKRLPQKLDDNQKRMTFDNGSFIESHPSRDDPARGRTVALIVIDEWAFFQNPESAWASVKPTFDIGGKVIALSTANGWGTLYHKMWVGAETGDNSFHPVFFPWWAVPERNQQWYDQQFKDMLEWQVHQEYPSSPTEAFIKSGNPVFNVDLLRTIVTVEPKVGYLHSYTGKPNDYEWRPSGSGPLRVWETPQPYVTYVVGADVAEGLEHGDYSCAHVIRCDTGAVVAVWHGKIDPDLFGLELNRLGLFYNKPLIGVEANNHGLTPLKTLQRLRYPRIYMRRRYGSAMETKSDALGWLTTKSTKPMAIDDLNSELREGTIGVFDKPTIQELLTYVRKDDGSMEGSPHDDRVISLAIANQMRRHAYTVAPQENTESPEFTFEWFNNLADEKKTSTVLGRHNSRKSETSRSARR